MNLSIDPSEPQYLVSNKSPIEDVITPILTSLRHSLAGGGQTQKPHYSQRRGLSLPLSRPSRSKLQKIRSPSQIAWGTKMFKRLGLSPHTPDFITSTSPTASSSLHHVYLGRSLYLGAYSSQEDNLEIYSGESQGHLYCLFRFVSTPYFTCVNGLLTEL